MSRLPSVNGATRNPSRGREQTIRDVKKRSFMINSCKFSIDARYVPIKPIGKGAYGVVCSAEDAVTNTKVAIKKITDAFDDLVDAKRILREIRILRHFDHENVIGIRDMLNPPLELPFNDIYIVLDLMDTDLERIIASNNVLTDHHMQYFIYQLLRGLKYIHSANVIHRDLKPSNLLLNADCDLKICDFGLARGVKDNVELTKYVVTRWYRAPELLCSCKDYTDKIDMWSVGCIFAELLGRTALFPGEDYIKQMDLIFSVLGTPSHEDIQFISNEKAYQYVRRLRPKPTIPFSQIYPDANPLALDLLTKMLRFNPHKRCTVDQALAHPWLKDLHVPETEFVCREPFNFDFEDNLTDKESIQDHMLEEVYRFRPFIKQLKRKMVADGTYGSGSLKPPSRTNSRQSRSGGTLSKGVKAMSLSRR